MARLDIHVCCASLSFHTLDEHALQYLKAAKLLTDDKALNRLRTCLGFPVDQVAIIDKCNAIIVVLLYSYNASGALVRQRLLDAWNKLSADGILSFMKMIEFSEGQEACAYLAECATGIHSVALGDSQVFSQVHGALSAAAHEQLSHPGLAALAHWIKLVHDEVTTKTALHAGHCSIERCASDRIAQAITGGDSVAIVGFGQSGQLVAKILGTERGAKLVISNRTPPQPDFLPDGATGTYVPLGDLSFVPRVSAIVVALKPHAETSRYAEILSESMKTSLRKNAIIVDMSSPSLLAPLCRGYFGTRFCDITALSRDTEEAKKKRKSEKSKARNIVSSRAKEAMSSLADANSRWMVEGQRRNAKSCRLTQQHLDLLRSRDAAFTAIRRYLHDDSFIEVNTPCIVGVSTDPPRVDAGQTIQVEWPGSRAYLRQSSQLYKQILVVSGQPRIYEIGPFWRGEAESTVRHLEETIGLDVETREPPNLDYLYELACGIVQAAIHGMAELDPELAHRTSFGNGHRAPVLEYGQSIEMLNKDGFRIAFGEDLGIDGESRLGTIVKREMSSDLFVIRRFPDTIKKFYTWRNNDHTTETFDIIFHGWELASGAVRETRAHELRDKMRMSGLNPDEYDFYLGILKKAPSHGGFGMGLDRLIAKALGFEEIRRAVVFPRTYERLIP